MSPEEEARHVAVIEAELCQEFPATDPKLVRAAISLALKEFAQAPIRDFVPLFVKRAAHAHLKFVDPA